MFPIVCESETSTQLPPQQAEFQLEKQAIQEVAEMSQTLQQHLQEIPVEHQQPNDWHPIYHKPPPPYPLHFLQSEFHEGHGESNIDSVIANINNNDLLSLLLNPTQTFHLKAPPPYPHHLQVQSHESNGDHEQSNNDLPLHPRNQHITPHSKLSNEPLNNETVFLEELEKFARVFKKRRIKLGFTQRDVGLAMRKLYGDDFSQTTISRFESLNLSLKNMCELKPFLQKWLDAANNALNNPSAKHNATDVPIRKQRKKRTIIGKTAVAALDKAFRVDLKPTNQEMAALADKLSLEKDVVRVWFGNRRARVRARRINPRLVLKMSVVSSHPPPNHQHDVFSKNQGSTGGPFPHSSPPPYSANHHIIQNN